MEPRLENIVKRPYNVERSPFDKVVTYIGREGVYGISVPEVSEDGFEVVINKIDGEKRDVVGKMNVDYKSKGPASFLPDFEKPSIDNKALSHLSVSYAMSAIRNDQVFDKYRLFLESDVDMSPDRGEEKIDLFNHLGKANNMRWNENKQGQQYTKKFS